MVLGAALFAANLSTTFRLRKFGMSDGVTYPVVFKVLHPHSLEVCNLRRSCFALRPCMLWQQQASCQTCTLQTVAQIVISPGMAGGDVGRGAG